MFESFLKPPVTFPTLTGSLVTFNSQYAGLALKSHVVDVVATQSGSGTPSPQNKRPISAYNAINISHSGEDTSTPTVYVINIGGTYLFGNYDAKTGLFQVTQKGDVFDGSEDEGWYQSTTFRCDVSSDFSSDNNTNYDVNMCNMFRYRLVTGSGQLADGDITWFSSTNRIFINSSYFADLTAFKTALANDPLVMVGKLATPTTIQLPPCPIDTLLGENNIWADTGDTTLQYIKLG